MKKAETPVLQNLKVDGCPGLLWTVVKVRKNDISGALHGVEVDCDVVEAGFSGNTLTGDFGSETIGIFSAAKSTIW